MARSKLRVCAASILLLGCLAGCAPAPALSQAEQANLANCTAQADAVYDQSNLNGLARTGQNGLLYPATPDQVFNGQRMGTMNVRNNQIGDCMANGNTSQPAPAAASLPTPQITGTP